jgi:hypothetical protein
VELHIERDGEGLYGTEHLSKVVGFYRALYSGRFSHSLCGGRVTR